MGSGGLINHMWLLWAAGREVLPSSQRHCSTAPGYLLYTHALLPPPPAPQPRTLLMKAYSSAALVLISPVRLLLISLAISATVS